MLKGDLQTEEKDISLSLMVPNNLEKTIRFDSSKEGHKVA